MNQFARDMMWLTAAGFGLMGGIAWAVLGFSVAYLGLFVLGFIFFIVGLVANDHGLV